MKQVSRIMSTYAFDLSGVCSALYELGGMVVMHDASGCNSSYTTFDEPRWYDKDSMIYASGLDEADAVLGNDDRLINDIISAAKRLHPKFIAVAGGPVPMMTGTDFAGIAEIIENRTAIPTFGFFTNGMNYYPYGAGLAFEAIAKRFCKSFPEKKRRAGAKPSCNLLGVTPLDFSVKGNVPALSAEFKSRGYDIISVWAMGENLETLAGAGKADVNVVASSCGLPAAIYMREKFGIPFVAGVPVGDAAADGLFKLIDIAAAKNCSKVLNVPGENSEAEPQALIIGEQVYANSMRFCLCRDYGIKNVRTLCPLSPDSRLLLPGDLATDSEKEIESAMRGCKIVAADPLYRMLLPKDEKIIFIDMPHEAFSGRLYEEQIPCIIGGAVHAHLTKYLTAISLKRELPNCCERKD